MYKQLKTAISRVILNWQTVDTFSLELLKNKNNLIYIFIKLSNNSEHFEVAFRGSTSWVHKKI